MTGIVDAILPLALRSDQELERAALLLDSLRAHWKGDASFNLTVVSPEATLAAASTRLQSSGRVNVHFHPEESFLNDAGFLGMPGWWKQQVIKLWVPARVLSGYYITFDSDIICIKDFHEGTFVDGNRAVTSWEFRDTQALWWANTYDTLEMEPSGSLFGLSVTPNVLHTELSGSIFTYLDDKFGNAITYLAVRQAKSMRSELGEGSPWTEYALYTTVNEHNRRLLQHHIGPHSYRKGKLRICLR